jgi:hypothetical protein
VTPLEAAGRVAACELLVHTWPALEPHPTLRPAHCCPPPTVTPSKSLHPSPNVAVSMLVRALGAIWVRSGFLGCARNAARMHWAASVLPTTAVAWA